MELDALLLMNLSLKSAHRIRCQVAFTVKQELFLLNPNMLIHSHNKVTIRTSTHLENTITDKDHELAKKNDDLGI
jgi:pterin-4a-carbinolamine dehydratase